MDWSKVWSYMPSFGPISNEDEGFYIIIPDLDYNLADTEQFINFSVYLTKLYVVYSAVVVFATFLLSDDILSVLSPCLYVPLSLLTG